MCCDLSPVLPPGCLCMQNCVDQRRRPELGRSHRCARPFLPQPVSLSPACGSRIPARSHPQRPTPRPLVLLTLSHGPSPPRPSPSLRQAVVHVCQAPIPVSLPPPHQGRHSVREYAESETRRRAQATWPRWSCMRRDGGVTTPRGGGVTRLGVAAAVGPPGGRMGAQPERFGRWVPGGGAGL